jgi:arylsulfatase A-like enzyme
MADDLGYTDVACYGSKYYETPNIDRLAAQGLRMLSHHHCQNCTPTRAALISGQYGARTGVYTVGGIDRFDWSQRPLRPVDNVTNLPLDRATVRAAIEAGRLRDRHVRQVAHRRAGEYHPGQRGFDEAIVSAGRHFDFVDQSANRVSRRAVPGRLPDRPRGRLSSSGTRTNRFFSTCRTSAFIPHQAKPELIEKFRDKPAVGGHSNPTYAAMIASVDESVGRVMQTLDELQLARTRC